MQSFFPCVRVLVLACAGVAPILGGCGRIEFATFPGDSLRDRIASKVTPATYTLAPVQRDFLTEAAQSSLFEIQASRVALARGGSAAVRRFAEATLRERVSVD